MLRWFAVVLALFCLLAVVRVEWLDYRAGGAIQQKLEQDPDTKWRVHRGPDAKPDAVDRVGLALKSWGLAVHPIAIFLTFLALFRQARDGPWRSGWSVLAASGLLCLIWVVFRQYLGCLGW